MNIKKCLTTLLACTLLSSTLIACGGGNSDVTFPVVANPDDFTQSTDLADLPTLDLDEDDVTETEETSSLSDDATDLTDDIDDLEDLDDLDDLLDDEDGVGGIGVETPDFTSDGVEVDKGLLNVTVRFPAGMLGEEQIDLDEYVRENKFSDAKLEADGSLLVTMSRGRHSELLSEMHDSILENLKDMVDSDEIGYITDYKTNGDLSKIEVFVDAEGYGEAFDFTLFSLSLGVSVYQMYQGDGIKYDISIVDNSTGEVLDAAVQPPVGE